MRIGFIRRKYDLSGGAEVSLRLLVEAFLQKGHQVAALAESWQGTPPSGMRFVEVAGGSGAGGARAFAANALNKLRALELDTCLSLERVPHVPFFRAGDGCHKAWLQHRAPFEGWLKRKTFALNPRHRTLLALEEQMFTSPSLKKVIANSRMVAEEITRYYNLPPAQIEVIYNPVDMKRLAAGQAAAPVLRSQLGLTGHEKILLFLGTGFERKGLAFIIKALPQLPNTRLLVAGQGSTAAYARLAEKLKVGRRVMFLGLRADAGALLAIAQALVLPTIYDPCANVCLEALAFGKPVVTTAANGAKEFIVPGKNGFVVENPANAAALAEACLRALALDGPVEARLNTMENWLSQIGLIMGVSR